MRGTAKDLIGGVNERDAYVVSLDVPSRLDATTGGTVGPVVDADHVLTLALPKTGFAQFNCLLSLTDISSPGWVYDHLEIQYKSPFGTCNTVPLVQIPG